MKQICIMMMGVTFSLAAVSQTTQQKVEKSLQDPQRKENAGKADVIYAGKKSIFDSTTFTSNKTEVVNKKSSAKTARKKCCKKPQ